MVEVMEEIPMMMKFGCGGGRVTKLAAVPRWEATASRG